MLTVDYKEIYLGTIGTGPIVHNILRGVQRSTGIRLSAVYSRDLLRGKDLAAEYGPCNVYDDLEELLADSRVNFVYVASPNTLHYEHTKKALLAGKNVLCEKPFCTRAQQAKELVTLARDRGLYLIHMVPLQFLPNLAVLQKKTFGHWTAETCDGKFYSVFQSI